MRETTGEIETETETGATETDDAHALLIIGREESMS